eukprot:scaffold421142_cov63-Attheya_sp.AAC.2
MIRTTGIHDKGRGPFIVPKTSSVHYVNRAWAVEHYLEFFFCSPQTVTRYQPTKLLAIKYLPYYPPVVIVY